MFKKLLLILVVLVCSSLYAGQNLQDVVYLKDGSVIHGTIIEQIPNVSIKIQRNDGDILVAQMDNVIKMTKEPVLNLANSGSGRSDNNNNNIDSRDYKSPGLAFLCSFILPGAGQYYNGDITKGVIMDVVYATGIVMWTGFGTEKKTTYYGYSTTKITPFLYIGTSLAIASELWSMIDAPISASAINRKNSKNNYGHLIEFNEGTNVLGLDMGPTVKGGVATKLTLHFNPAQIGL